MDLLLSCLSQLGLGLATDAIYDFIKSLAGKHIGPQDFAREIENKINQHGGISVSAETIVKALTEKGVVSFQPQTAAVRIIGSGAFSGNTISIGKVTGFDQVLVVDSTGIVANNSINIGKAEK